MLKIPVFKASLLWAPGPLQSHLHQDGYDNLLVVMAGRKDVVYNGVDTFPPLWGAVFHAFEAVFPRVFQRHPSRTGHRRHTPSPHTPCGLFYLVLPLVGF